MKKTSIALCAVLFGALVVSNVFAEENLVASNEAAATETGAVVETPAETNAEETTAAEATTGDVAAEAEKSINDELHAILDKYFEDNASKFNTTKDKKDFFETVKANINKAAENAIEAQKEAFEILKGALETYEIK